jgi:protein gp37
MKTTVWNPVRMSKIISGCKNCYIALGDAKKGKELISH